MDGALLDDDPKQRLEGLKRILQARDRAALEGVVERLGHEKDPKVRAAMVYTLGVLGDRAHIPMLAYLTQARDVELRLRSVQALAKIRHPAGFPSLIRCLAGDPDERVRRVAFQAVIRVGSDNLLTLLQRMIASRKDWQRESAIQVCSQFNSPLVVPLLVEAHQAGTEEEAALALRGLEHLGRLGNSLAIEALGRIKSRDREMEALRFALEAQMKKLWEMDRESFDFEKSHTGGLQRVEMEVSPISGEVEASRAAPAPPPPPDRPAVALPADQSFFSTPVEEADFDVSRTVDRIEAFEPDAVSRLEKKVHALSRRIDTAAPAEIPTVIRRGGTTYRLMQQVDSGPEGAVYQARVEGEHRDVVLALFPRTPADQDGRRRLEREIEVHRALSHPNLRHLLDGGCAGELSFRVVELVDGSKLYEGVGSRPVSLAEFLCLARPMAAALQYLHSRGSVHGALEPGRILLTTEGEIKIGDFGLMRMIDVTDITIDPAHVAPEVLAGGDRTSAADMYSLGVIFKDLLIGEEDSGSPQIEALIVRLMSQAPRNRPDAGQVLEILSGAGSSVQTAPSSAAAPAHQSPSVPARAPSVQPPAVAAPAPAPVPRDRRKLLLYTAGILFPVIALPVIWHFFGPEPEPLPLEQAPVRSTGTGRFDRGDQ